MAGYPDPDGGHITHLNDAPGGADHAAWPHEGGQLRDIHARPGEGRRAAAPAHREYLTRLLADGRLAACGPFADGSGALFIYEAASLAAAEEILAADPYHQE